MLGLSHKPAMALAFLGGVAACAQAATPVEQAAFRPVYLGVDTRLLEGDLVEFRVTMRGARARADVADYAKCAAAQYALIRGYGFARHLRTTIKQDNGVWTGNSVYTISPALPDGLRTIDAAVTAADCAETGIPMV